jgi:hypothetical protein
MFWRIVFFMCLVVGLVPVWAGEKDEIPAQMKSSPRVVKKDDLKKLSKWPIFKDMVWDNVYLSQVFNEGPAPTDFVVELWVKKPVKIGGITYPRGTFVSGIGTLFRMGGEKMVVEVNSQKVCGNLGQDGLSLEIFEIKLCEDLKLAEGVIPAGSVIDFPKGIPKSGIKFSDIRCLLPAKATSLKGRPVKPGAEITPNYEVWQEPDRDCMRGGD